MTGDDQGPVEVLQEAHCCLRQLTLLEHLNLLSSLRYHQIPVCWILNMPYIYMAGIKSEFITIKNLSQHFPRLLTILHYFFVILDTKLTK